MILEELLSARSDDWQRTVLGRRAETEIRYAQEVAAALGLDLPAGLDEAARALGAEPGEDEVLALETLLKPLTDRSPVREVLLVGHAHIDMNWQWGYDETAAVTLATFETTLDLMDEYPDFTFGQSQAECYRIVEQYDPALLARIRRRVEEGRWEVTAAAWVEADRNLPGTETAIRQMLYARQYLTALLGPAAGDGALSFEPDTFGHGAHIPELLARGGVRYLYHCRGEEGAHIFRWQAPSGAEVLTYREPFWYDELWDYHNDFRREIRFLPAFAGQYGLSKVLKVFGVGDHGGGVTRRQLEMFAEMKTYPLLPVLRGGTYREFFAHLEERREQFPVRTGELNCCFDGCYTSQSRIKQEHRYAEQNLRDAEAVQVFARLCEGPGCSAPLTEAWRKVLFNCFHDILPGSCTTASKEYALALCQEADAAADSVRSVALRQLAAKVDTRFLSAETALDGEGAGCGYGLRGGGGVSRAGGRERAFLVTNTLGFARTAVVEIPLFDYGYSYADLEARTAAGNTLRHQLLDDAPQSYWRHRYVRVLVEVPLPAFGFETVVFAARRRFHSFVIPENIRVTGVLCMQLENEFLRVEFDQRSFAVKRIVDRRSGNALFAGEGCSFSLVREDPTRMMTAWCVGRFGSEEALTRDVRLVRGSLRKGALRNSFTYRIERGDTSLEVEVSLQGKSLRYRVDVVWREEAVADRSVPLLRFRLPLSAQALCRCGVPGGVVLRERADHDIPVSEFLAVSDRDGHDWLLVSRDNYGFRFDEEGVALSLLRSSYDPEQYHEYGRHTFSFALQPGEGRTDADCWRAALAERTDAAFYSLKPGRKGSLASCANFLEFRAQHCVLTAAKESEDHAGNLFRITEVDGVGERAVLRAAGAVRAQLTDFHERPIAELTVEDGRVSVDCAPYATTTVLIQSAAGGVST